MKEMNLPRDRFLTAEEEKELLLKYGPSGPEADADCYSAVVEHQSGKTVYDETETIAIHGKEIKIPVRKPNAEKTVDGDSSFCDRLYATLTRAGDCVFADFCFRDEARAKAWRSFLFKLYDDEILIAHSAFVGNVKSFEDSDGEKQFSLVFIAASWDVNQKLQDVITGLSLLGIARDYYDDLIYSD